MITRGQQAIRTLFIHDNLPRPEKSGAEKRIALLLEELWRQGHAITFLARCGVGQEEYARALAGVCEQVYHTDIEHLRYLGWPQTPKFRLLEILRDGNFDVAILTHWHWNGLAVSEQYLDEIRRISPRTRIAVLSEDHHGWREARLAQLSGQWQDWERAYDYEARELEVYGRADVVLAVSPADRDGILRLAPEAPIEVLPPVADEVEPATTPFADRSGLLFLGEYANPANCDGIEWFLREIWPLALAQAPNLRLSLAGSNLPREYLRFPNVDGLGFLPDLGPAYARHRVALCPIRYGTGIKTKNLAALAYGLPLVTTSIGAEGMGLRDGREAAIADDPASFAARVLRLHEERETWETMARAARAHADAAFSRPRLAACFATVIAQVLARDPKPAMPPGDQSPLAVEVFHPEVLEPQPDILQRRALAYISLGERYLVQGAPAAARTQFRHALTFLRDRTNAAMPRLEAGLLRCQGAVELDYFADLRTARPPVPRPRAARSPERQRPYFSAVIPTRNRRATLEKCLTALAVQTLPAERFEVVVIDDGSEDDTEAWCRAWQAPFAFSYRRQAHAGIGAARRLGVELAGGEILWLANDDTIAAPGLLAAHLAAWRRCQGENLAILGDFRYPRGAVRRALTHTLSITPTLFPQVTMPAGSRHDYRMFMTCNLSVPRDAVLRAGNFDARFAVAEDTELGVRMEQQGFAVFYEPAAVTWHDHLDFTAADLVARARRYGPADLLLCRKHPHLLGDGGTPLGRLDAETFAAMQSFLLRNRRDIEAAVRALAQFDEIDFLPYFAKPTPNGNAGGDVAALFAAAIPKIHGFYVYESLLAAQQREAAAAAPALAVPQWEAASTRIG